MIKGRLLLLLCSACVVALEVGLDGSAFAAEGWAEALDEDGVRRFERFDVAGAWLCWHRVVAGGRASVAAVAAAHRNLAVVRGWEFAAGQPHEFRLRNGVDPLLARNWTAALVHARLGAEAACASLDAASCRDARDRVRYVFLRQHAAAATDLVSAAWRARTRGKDRPAYVEIGTANWHALALHFAALAGTGVEGDWRGLSVEPLRRFAEALPRSPGRDVVRAMVCDHDGEGTLRSAVSNPSEDQYRGMSHSAASPFPPSGVPAGVFEDVAVPCLRLATLLADFEGDVDLLKVDAEGADFDVVHAALDWAALNARRVERVVFENNLRSDAQIAAGPGSFGRRRDATLARLRAAHYACACTPEDCDCVLGDPP